MASHITIIGILFLIFFLEGAIIGKFFPTLVIFPTYLIQYDFAVLTTIVLVVGSAIAASLGQYIILRLVQERFTIPSVTQYVWKTVTTSKIYNFYRKQHPNITPNKILISNIIPGLRGLCIVPIANKNYTTQEIMVATFAGNIIHLAGVALLVVSGIIVI